MWSDDSHECSVLLSRCLGHRSERGFSASWSPSPTRLKARTVRTSATPGKSMYHQAESKIGTADAIIWPQLAVGGCTPTPRNDSAASKSTLVGRMSVV